MTGATVKKVLRAAFAVLSIGGLAYATVAQWPKVSDTVAALDAGDLALAVVATFAGTYVSMLSWRSILADLGSPLRTKHAIGIFFVGQLGKYLPGSVWPVVAQMELGREHGVPRKRSAVAALLAILVGLTAGGIVAAATLPFAASGSLKPYRAVFVLPALGLVLMHPAVFARVTAFGLRLLKRQPLDRGLSARGIATALMWSTVQWALWGLAVYVVAWQPVAGPSYALCLGAYAVSWTAGFLFLVAPAGAGVREGALVLLLGTSIGNVPALGVALVLRLLATLSDLFWGLVAFAEGGRDALRRRRLPEMPDL